MSTTEKTNNINKNEFKTPKSKPKRKVTFSSIKCHNFELCQSPNSVPREGNIALGIGEYINTEDVTIDNFEDKNKKNKKRHPCPNVSEELQPLSNEERKLRLEMSGLCISSKDNDVEYIRLSRKKHFCNCVNNCKENSNCPCVKDEVGCHIESSIGCKCTRLKKACLNPYGSYRYNSKSINQLRKNMLSSYDSSLPNPNPKQNNPDIFEIEEKIKQLFLTSPVTQNHLSRIESTPSTPQSYSQTSHNELTFTTPVSNSKSKSNIIPRRSPRLSHLSKPPALSSLETLSTLIDESYSSSSTLHDNA